MISLGINAAFHDSAATLVIDGRVVAAAEEERFTRIKHGKRPLPFTAWELPFHAIDYCLAEADLTLADVDHVAYSYDPARFLRDRVMTTPRPTGTSAGPPRGPGPAWERPGARPGDAATISLPLEPSAHEKGVWENVWDPLFAAYIVNAPRQLADGAPHHLKKRFAGVTHDGPYRFHFVDHHLCHQASAFLASPFERCAVMTLDGRGEEATTSYGVYRDQHYAPLGEVCMPHSLGMLYEQITSHLGFLHSSDEYKVMALAALGKPRFRGVLEEHIRIGADGQYEIAPMDLAGLFGPPRERGGAMDPRYLDLAASLQVVLEETVLRLAKWLREASGEPLLAMAGGVALNCVMNAKLRDARLFEQVWVQPAAGDAGTALGAALWIDSQARVREGADTPWAHDEKGSRIAERHWQMDHAYLGPGHEDDAIEVFLKWAKLPYQRLHDPADATARLLADNQVIGWYQGRMEFGPRALGGRSIIASPIAPEMQARINELKDREDFRPVAPAIPREHLADWFTPAEANGGSAPFMLFIYDVIEAQAKRIPAACHSDRTARVQTVTADSNPRFHALLEAFGSLTGVPVLINTSFNVRGEPVVCTPKDAIDAFYSTPIDALVIGSFLLEKSR